MHRLIFWGIIILVVVLLFFLVGAIIYWLLRIFMAKLMARNVSWCIILLMLVVIGISVWWGHTHTRLQIQVNHVEIPSPRLPETFDGFRIAQISDMHINSFTADEGRTFLAQLADTLEAQQPDIIVFTGDLVTIRSAEALPFRESLHRIGHIPSQNGQTIPVYSILGNHDYADYMRNFDDARRQLDVDSLIQTQEAAGWHMLRNDAVRISRENPDSLTQHLSILGVENIGEPPFSVYGDLSKAFSALSDSIDQGQNFNVLLSHNPTHWRSEALSYPVDLMLAGHTHAMQFMIGNWSPSSWKYPEWAGLYTHKGTTPQYLYVNTGFGCVGPTVRIGVKPEVTILTLRHTD